MKPSKKLYLVNRDFQLRYAYLAVAVGFITTALSVFVLLYPLYMFEILRIARFLPMPILIGMGAAVVVNIVVIGMAGVFVTHRIAGPMYALARCFRRIEMGGWAGHLQVRQKDDLKYLVRNFNLMVDGMCASTQADLKLMDEALQALPAGEQGKVAERLNLLRERLASRLEVVEIEGQVQDEGGSRD